MTEQRQTGEQGRFNPRVIGIAAALCLALIAVSVAGVVQLSAQGGALGAAGNEAAFESASAGASGTRPASGAALSGSADSASAGEGNEGAATSSAASQAASAAAQSASVAGSADGAGGAANAGNAGAASNASQADATTTPGQSQASARISVQLTISCAEALDALPAQWREWYPNGLMRSAQLTLDAGSTVYSALRATDALIGASSQATGTYIYSIDGLAQKQAGAQSGWVYYVNGSRPGYASDNFVLHTGDVVEWRYVLSA